MNLGRKLVRRGALAGVALFALLQAKQVDHTNPPAGQEVDAPPEVKAILRRSCYDCHSHRTRWPWYSHVAPASWFVARHVRQGRNDMNFSEWPRFDLEKQEEIFGDVRKMISEGKMPLWSYLLLHPGARLSQADKAVLLDWAAAAP